MKATPMPMRTRQFERRQNRRRWGDNYPVPRYTGWAVALAFIAGLLVAYGLSDLV